MKRGHLWITWLGMGIFALIPPLIVLFDQSVFYTEMFSRVMILALAAMSLDLVLGFGGMVSFGHAVYIGIGAYTVGIFSYYGIDNGFIQFPVTVAVCGVIAFAIGAMSLRTSGVYFIMITLAFAQMIYFLGISLEEFGGDDGMPVNRSEFGGLIDLYDTNSFYYFVFVMLLVLLFLSHRLIHSRFGMVLQGTKSNDVRMKALGFPVFRYKLTAFVIAGMMCGIAGALFANWNEFVSPASMHWTRSGELLIMVILGGMGTLFGPVLGTVLFLLLEEYLPELMDLLLFPGAGEHWMGVFGPILILLVLFARGGVHSILAGPMTRHG